MTVEKQQFDGELVKQLKQKEKKLLKEYSKTYRLGIKSMKRNIKTMQKF